MFMRNNRALNGAPQPVDTAADEESLMREQETLFTRPAVGTPQERTFEPDLMTIEAITRRHVRGGLDEGEWPDYEEHIPVGPKMG